MTEENEMTEEIVASEEAEVAQTKDSPSAESPESADLGEAETERSTHRKIREGLVVSAKMDKTVTVAIIDRVRHRRYGKTMQRTKKFYAHDESNEVREGDRVRIMETRPLSRLKRWRVLEILERAR